MLFFNYFFKRLKQIGYINFVDNVWYHIHAEFYRVCRFRKTLSALSNSYFFYQTVLHSGSILLMHFDSVLNLRITTAR